MGKTRTTWRKGQSGNPAGRRPNAKARDALRKALNQPIGPGASETRMEQWANEIVTQAVALEDRLAILKFLEGTSPPQSTNDDDDAPTAALRPRIVIPGSGVR